MASKPLRPCRAPGCRNLTSSGYCQEHQALRPRLEGLERGDSAAWHSWYWTTLWRKELRPQQLAREPWCRECAKRGLRVRATDVDHVVPHNGDWYAFTHGELQSLCHSCHSRKTLRELGKKTQKRGGR